jgi:hypothetical protein
VRLSPCSLISLADKRGGGGGHSLRAPAEVDPDRDWTIGRLASASRSRIGISKLKGVERCACVDRINSPTQDFVGLVRLVGCCSYHGHDNVVALVESRENAAKI